MARWVYIEQGVIKEYRDTLPKSWKNISGLDKASPAQLKSLGWLPVENIPIEVDENYYEIDGADYIIHSDKVEQRMRSKRLSNSLIAERQDKQRIEFLNALRQERNRRISECDWTQLADVQSIKDKSWRDEWSQYRQALRDILNAYSNTTTFDLNSVEWPVPPSL